MAESAQEAQPGGPGVDDDGPIRGQSRGQGQAQQRDPSDELHGAVPVALHDHQYQQVQHHTRDAAEGTVLRGTVPPRQVVHYHLADSRTLYGGEDRQHAVLLSVGPDELSQSGAPHLEGAAGVVQVHARHTRDDGVRHVGGNRTDQIVLALLAPAAHQVEVVHQEGLHHLGDVLRVVLKVSVHCHQSDALRMLNTCSECRSLAEIPAENYCRHVVTLRRHRLQ
mmetsp:Transcript_19897/g.33418  ORF Transcript_19897/g.33418 Transcript_19897/m.33418 type:complete len:223 (-) Transcript_19897:799-1467(-)